MFSQETMSQATYAEDEEIQKNMTELLVQGGEVAHYYYTKDLLFYKNRVYVGAEGSLRKDIIQNAH